MTNKPDGTVNLIPRTAFSSGEVIAMVGGAAVITFFIGYCTKIGIDIIKERKAIKEEAAVRVEKSISVEADDNTHEGNNEEYSIPFHKSA